MSKSCVRCGDEFTSPYPQQKRCKPCIPLALGEKGRRDALASYHRRKDDLKDRHHKETLVKFGLTEADYQKMVDRQAGLCAICAEPPKPPYKRLVIDHDHRCCPGRTGCPNCIRGLLCMDCNKAIGLLRDNPMMLKVAAAYLNNYGVPDVH